MNKDLSTPKNLEVLYEDNHLIAVNKKNSDIVQGDKTKDTPLSEVVRQYVKEKYNKPGNVYLGVIHRLDRPVSGVVIFSKTSKALSRMNELFKKKDIQKTYWAVVENGPNKPAETIVHYLVKNQEKNKSMAFPNERKNSKRAELDYKLVGKGNKYWFLEVLPKTGRHHQIRVQLSKIGCIIKGDLKYGAKRSNKNSGIHLHARKVEFTHPVSGDNIIIIAPPPEEILWNEFLKLNA